MVDQLSVDSAFLENIGDFCGCHCSPCHQAIRLKGNEVGVMTIPSMRGIQESRRSIEEGLQVFASSIAQVDQSPNTKNCEKNSCSHFIFGSLFQPWFSVQWPLPWAGNGVGWGELERGEVTLSWVHFTPLLPLSFLWSHVFCVCRQWDYFMGFPG